MPFMDKLYNRYRNRPGAAPINANTVADIIHSGMHGICFSPYVEGQEPGSELSTTQIESRLSIISPHVEWIRSFSCTQGNELIPAVAKKMGLKTLVGVWIDDDLETNERELENAIALGKQGLIDVLAVGNEVLLREDIPESLLIDYIKRAKQALPTIQVGYVDAYYLFENHPAVANECDVILANCYPFWEGYSIDHASVYMRDMYYRAKAVAQHKPVIITETGWPNQGSDVGQAQPSEDNAKRYFVETYQWANTTGVDVFYFSSFDEAWKVSDEGDVGAFWGLWDKDGKPKFWDPEV